MEKSVFCDPAFRLCRSESQRIKDFGSIEAFIRLKTVEQNFFISLWRKLSSRMLDKCALFAVAACL